MEKPPLRHCCECQPGIDDDSMVGSPEVSAAAHELCSYSATSTSRSPPSLSCSLWSLGICIDAVCLAKLSLRAFVMEVVSCMVQIPQVTVLIVWDFAAKGPRQRCCWSDLLPCGILLRCKFCNQYIGCLQPYITAKPNMSLLLPRYPPPLVDDDAESTLEFLHDRAR